jgi:hypothetical protein
LGGFFVCVLCFDVASGVRRIFVKIRINSWNAPAFRLPIGYATTKRAPIYTACFSIGEMAIS